MNAEEFIHNDSDESVTEKISDIDIIDNVLISEEHMMKLVRDICPDEEIDQLD